MSSERSGSRLLLDSAARGHLRVLKVLLEKGADIETKYYGGWTTLHVAIGQRCDEVVKTLLENGAKIEATHGGHTALYIAAERGHENMLRALLESGVDIGVKGRRVRQLCMVQLVIVTRG